MQQARITSTKAVKKPCICLTCCLDNAWWNFAVEAFVIIKSYLQIILFLDCSAPSRDNPLPHHTAQLLVTLANVTCINAFLVAVSCETQAEAQPCRLKWLSNSILPKPASSHRRGRHSGLILILLAFHQCIPLPLKVLLWHSSTIRRIKNKPLK